MELRCTDEKWKDLWGPGLSTVYILDHLQTWALDLNFLGVTVKFERPIKGDLSGDTTYDQPYSLPGEKSQTCKVQDVVR